MFINMKMARLVLAHPQLVNTKCRNTTASIGSATMGLKLNWLNIVVHNHQPLHQTNLAGSVFVFVCGQIRLMREKPDGVGSFVYVV